MSATTFLSSPVASKNAPGLDYQLFTNIKDFGAKCDGITDDSTAVQAAIDSLRLTGGNILVPGPTAIGTNLIPRSNVSIIGLGRNISYIVLTGSATGIFVASTTVNNIRFSGITFDANSQGSCILLLGQQNNDIALDNCRFKNAVLNSIVSGIGWTVAIGNASGSQSTNIIFTDNIVGPSTPFLESCILINCLNFTIKGNIFTGNTGNAATCGLALYAYCRGGSVVDNAFYNNQGIDCYIQQSDTITFSNNTFVGLNTGNCLGIYTCQGLTIDGCSFIDLSGTRNAIVVFDVLDNDLAHFNNLSALYTRTQFCTISDCRFNGFFSSVQIYATPAGIGASQCAVNKATDIIIDNCRALNVTGSPFIIGGINAQDMERISLTNCSVDSGTYSGGTAVYIRGNPAYAGTNTTQAINANAAAQTVSVTSSTGINVGGWYSIDTGLNQEDIYIRSVPDGTHINAIFSKTHSNGVAISLSTSVISNGITDCLISQFGGMASTAGNSSGITIQDATLVRLLDNDLRNLKSGTGVRVSLVGVGAYQLAQRNLGYNPLGAVTTPAFPASTVWQQNTTGTDIVAYLGLAGVTQTHIYVNGSVASTVGAVDLTTQAPSSVVIPAGGFFRMDYSAGSPSWKWQGL